MNPERAQMLREIEMEFHASYCPKCEFFKDCSGFRCEDWNLYLESLFAEAESQTEPKGE